MNSARFPGKVLKGIGGEPVLWHIVNRLRSVKKLGDIIIATSSERCDDPIEKFARENNVKLFRGSM